MSNSTGRETILAVRSVSKIYRMGEVDVPALRDTTMKAGMAASVVE